MLASDSAYSRPPGPPGGDPHEGGVFRISLTYDSSDVAGKSTAQTDTYHGHFAER